jgi:hypothetical protein
MVPISRTCPWWYASQCHLVGHYGHIYSIGPFAAGQNPGTIILTSTRQPAGIQIPVTDVRRGPETKMQHRLAVCLQPVFLLADWTILVQFFEIWISQRATLFFVYLQSLAPEVDALLRAYESERDITVMRVQWPAMPIMDNTFDPNDLVYRTEVVTAINDCILRARRLADYVVASDLDEIVVPFANRTILDLIEDYRMGNDSIAALVIRSSNVLFKVERKIRRFGWEKFQN